MKHAELEETLRATLAGRADTVTRGPDWRVPAGSPLGTRRRTARWFAPLAAAAAVAAVVVSVVAIEHHSGGRHLPPATQQPTNSPTTGRATTSAAPAPNVPLVCSATLPTAWTNAIRNSRLDFGAMAAAVTDVGPDGSVVVSRDFGVTPGSLRDVVVLSPRGPFREVYQVADPDRHDATAEIYRHWLVVAIESRRRAPAHSIPNSPPPTVERLLTIDLNTRAQHEITALPPPDTTHPGMDPMIEVTAVLNGRVYWDVRPRYASKSATIKSYDLRSGTIRTEYTGPIGYYPTVSAAGIGSSGRIDNAVYVPAKLPPVVAAGVNPQLPMYVSTDSKSWAWVKNAHEYGWWTKGLRTPVYVRTPRPIDLDNGPSGFVVSGHFVFTDSQVIDVTARAAAPLTGHGLPAGKFAGFAPQRAHDGVLYGIEYAGTGHYVDGYWQDPQPQVQRVYTSNGLPGLHC